MIITIDSNVASVPVQVVRLLPRYIVTTPWCTDPCVCNNIDGSSSSSNVTPSDQEDRVLYDTPIAMCPDADNALTDPDNTVSFVYLDVGVKNRSYGRIMNNLPRLKTTATVVISANADTADAEPKGTYTVVLDKNNCGTDMVVKFMALMVNTFIQRKLILRPESLLDVVRKVPNPRERCIDGDGSPVRCDLYSFSKENNRRTTRVVDDCDLLRSTVA